MDEEIKMDKENDIMVVNVPAHHDIIESKTVYDMKSVSLNSNIYIIMHDWIIRDISRFEFEVTTLSTDQKCITNFSCNKTFFRTICFECIKIKINLKQIKLILNTFNKFCTYIFSSFSSIRINEFDQCTHQLYCFILYRHG